MQQSSLIFHILPNAHLDPVWLWDWREGLNEGLTTVRTILDLMDEFPKLTFLRGEAVIYEHIQKCAPSVFRRMRDRIEEGRWDVVGGTYVQPDSNLSSSETLCRQFERSLKYFKKELGVRPTVSWQADSFGHAAGWPNILRSFGMKDFAFTRPERRDFPMDSPAFWWECDYPDHLLCYRQHFPGYCSERFNLPEVLERTLRAAEGQPYQNVGILIGLGNHGGGPTRRHLSDIEKWGKQHPSIELRYSTLHGFFKSLHSELDLPSGKQAPRLNGEFGYCLRGCYSSVQKFKALYRQAEASVSSAESTHSFIRAKFGGRTADLDEAWEAILFNSFHDILPGTSIERAMEDQTAWTGLALHHAQKARFEALNHLASKIDTRVPPPISKDHPTEVPFLLWNPLPRAYTGPIEIEASLDHRPFFNYENRSNELPYALRDEAGCIAPFQEIHTEHTSMPNLPWRKRVIVSTTIPPLGWKIYRLGLAKETPIFRKIKNSCTAHGGGKPWIANSNWRIGSDGQGGMTIKRDGLDFLLNRKKLRLVVVEDPWGSWGGMTEETNSYCLDQVREEWKITEYHILETGPERSRIWTRWQGKQSWVDLTFDLCRILPWITVHGRLLWNERSARLQLIIPSVGEAHCDVPGSVVTRKNRGQVPVGRWFYRLNNRGNRIGIASDVLGDADFLPKETRLTLARATRYANDVPTVADDKRWQAAVDCGELKFRLCFFTDGVEPDHVASSLLYPIVALPVTSSGGPGSLSRTGSVGEITPDTVKLLSAKISGKRLEIRIQNRGAKAVSAKFRLGTRIHSLGELGAQQIRTLSINPIQ